MRLPFAPISRRRRRLRYALPAFTVTSLALMLLTTAADATSPAVTRVWLRPAQFRPAFRRLGTAAYLLKAGNYVFAASASPVTRSLGTLYNERTGRHTLLALPPGCRGSSGPSPTGPAVMGGRWVAVECSDASTVEIQLYDLTRRTWTTVLPGGSIRPYCAPAVSSACVPVAVGDRWLEFDEQCYHCRDTFAFQNLATGTTRPDPTNRTTYADPNSSALAKRICRPLRFPAGGSLFFDGRFGIFGTARGVFLEQCGSRLHRRLGLATPSTSTRQATLWISGAQQLRGLFFRGLRPFVVTLPISIGTPRAALLTSRHLYVLAGATDTLWRTNRPQGME